MLSVIGSRRLMFKMSFGMMRYSVGSDRAQVQGLNDMMKFAQKKVAQDQEDEIEGEGAEDGLEDDKETSMRRKKNRPGRIERAKMLRARIKEEKERNKPVIQFSQEELDKIFKPELAQSLLKAK